jgi:hypothetical protein
MIEKAKELKRISFETNELPNIIPSACKMNKYKKGCF